MVINKKSILHLAFNYASAIKDKDLQNSANKKAAGNVRRHWPRPLYLLGNTGLNFLRKPTGGKTPFEAPPCLGLQDITSHHIINKVRMNFTKLVPNVFYSDIKVGLRLFIECLEFSIGHDELNSDHPFCAIDKDGLSLLLFQNKEYAEKDRPEFRLVTNDIEEVYKKVASTHPEFLHPNLKEITPRPWGAREFALKDDSNVCIIIQQW